MDPITALAAASAIWSGIKACVDTGREVQDVWGQLSQWADNAGQVYDYIAEQESKPSIFRKLEFKTSDTKEAFNIFTARVKMREMESEIKHMFLYGALNHLGMDGYKEFLDIRQQIRVERYKQQQQQQRAKESFKEDLKYGAILTSLLLFLAGLLWWLYINMKG
jgi:hypothetical protein